MTTDEPCRRWLFKVTDWNDDEFYVDADGKQSSYDDVPKFVGTDYEALQEGDRRADLWEQKYDALAARVTRESQGIVKGETDGETG
jgi:hypothetical protein